MLRRGQRRRRRSHDTPPGSPALAQNLRGDLEPGEFALRLVLLIADSLQQPRAAVSGDGIAQVEEQAIAFDDAIDFGRRIKPCRGGAMAVPRARCRTEHDAIAVLLRPHAPLNVLPIERIVGHAVACVAAQRSGAKQRGAAAGAKAVTRLGRRTGRGMENADAGCVAVPIDPSRFFATPIRALLQDLCADGKDVTAAERCELAQRVALERHVVVQE